MQKFRTDGISGVFVSLLWKVSEYMQNETHLGNNFTEKYI